MLHETVIGSHSLITAGLGYPVSPPSLHVHSFSMPYVSLQPSFVLLTTKVLFPQSTWLSTFASTDFLYLMFCRWSLLLLHLHQKETVSYNYIQHQGGSLWKTFYFQETCTKYRNKTGMRNSRTLPPLRNNGGLLSGLQCNALASLVHIVTYTTKWTRHASLLHWRPERWPQWFYSD